MSLIKDVEILAEQGPRLQEGLCWQTMPKVLELLRMLTRMYEAGAKGDERTTVFWLQRVHAEMTSE